MEARTRRLARLARLLHQRKASLEAQQAAFDIQARAIEEQRRALLQTVGASITAHGLFVDLLAGRMKRLDAESDRIEPQAAALAVQMRENVRRVRILERLRAEANRNEVRDRANRELADLIDAGRTALAASFRKG